ncbi:MAG: CotH kinase family protein [Deltaproteobacteria bacterium]|nr:CotH kinase family protein [Deltaproteobacteria bacterium]
MKDTFRIETVHCLVLCLGVLTYAGCSKNKSSSGDSESASESESFSASVGDDSDTGTDTELVSGDIFAMDKVHQLDITLPEADWTALRQNARDEQFTQVDVTIDGEHVGISGLRFKGSYGNLYGCFNNADELICNKLSMKLKFSEYEKDQTFQGMKRLNLHSMERDESLLAEYLGYDLYRNMGIMTSRTSYGEVSVNGENLGLFALVEQIDGRFTQNRFEDNNNNGDLYKEAWPFYDDMEYFAQHIKTNAETATHEEMLAFTKSLKEATDDMLPSLVSSYVDVDYMFRYIAVNEAINNWDGIMMWYCFSDDSECGNHNYYWYQEETRPFFWLLPWDLDSTFITRAWNGNPPRWNDLDVNCDERVTLPESTMKAFPPACDPLTRGLALMGNEPFAAVVNELLTNYFNETVLYQKIDNVVSLITPAVERDPDRTQSSWTGQVAQLKTNIRRLIQRITQMRDGIPISPMYLSGSGATDFESESNSGLYMTTFLLANPGSSVEFEINEATPLNGEKDLRMNFLFFDDGKSAWDHWAFGEMMLDSLTDMSSLEALRVTVVADTERQMAFRLGSLESATQESGASWGWEFSVTDTPQTIDLPVTDLAYPWWWSGDEDNIATILANVNALRVLAEPNNVGDNGLMSEPEDAFVQVDDIQFIMSNANADDTDTDSDTDSDSATTTDTDTNSGSDTATDTQ